MITVGSIATTHITEDDLAMNTRSMGAIYISDEINTARTDHTDRTEKEVELV